MELLASNTILEFADIDAIFLDTLLNALFFGAAIRCRKTTYG
jgi:hypothetical protein